MGEVNIFVNIFVNILVPPADELKEDQNLRLLVIGISLILFGVAGAGRRSQFHLNVRLFSRPIGRGLFELPNRIEGRQSEGGCQRRDGIGQRYGFVKGLQTIHPTRISASVFWRDS